MVAASPTQAGEVGARAATRVSGPGQRRAARRRAGGDRRTSVSAWAAPVTSTAIRRSAGRPFSSNTRATAAESAASATKP